ncbi:hypothetical protein J4477_03680 [Candidatus Pacearchaeota archaeon]|nr:hypothetical protein [Candidatus Pacearchaeota archaeon]
MKTFEDYLRFVRSMSQVLDSDETKELVRKQRSKGFQRGYVASYELSIYPTHDNQLLFVDLGIEDLKIMLESLGFQSSGQRTMSESRWDFHNKGSFVQDSMMYGDQDITAHVGFDPARIYFASLDKKVVKTAVGLRSETPEVEFLGKWYNSGDESRLIAPISLSSFVTLHPNGATPNELSENVVIALLKQIMERRVNGFYGNFKSRKGVLHQV